MATMVLLNNAREVLGMVFGAYVAVALVGWALYAMAAYYESRTARRVLPIRLGLKAVLASCAIFFAFVLMLALMTNAVTLRARMLVRSFVSDNRGQISVVGMPAAQAARYVAGLEEVCFAWKHKSHPTECRALTLVGPKQRMTLQVCRDSARKDEFWVFWPVLDILRTNEIGRIYLSEP